MNSHELGDEYEKVCKAYLEELYSKTNPQFIDTKLDKVHGIDFAMSLNDDEIIFIIESKGKYGKMSEKQMTKEWINERITPTLAEKLKNNIAKNGIIKYLSFRVDNSDSENPIIKRISRSGFLDKEDLSSLEQSDIQNSTNNFTQKNTKTMARSSFQYQIELLEALKQRLAAFADSLEGMADKYEKQIDNLHGAGLMDEIYEDYKINCLEQTKLRIKGLVDNLKETDVKEIEKIIEKLGYF